VRNRLIPDSLRSIRATALPLMVSAKSHESRNVPYLQGNTPRGGELFETDVVFESFQLGLGDACHKTSLPLKPVKEGFALIPPRLTARYRVALVCYITCSSRLSYFPPSRPSLSNG
jgi:hypothetical protein